MWINTDYGVLVNSNKIVSFDFDRERELYFATLEDGNKLAIIKKYDTQDHNFKKKHGQEEYTEEKLSDIFYSKVHRLKDLLNYVDMDSIESKIEVDMATSRDEELALEMVYEMKSWSYLQKDIVKLMRGKIGANKVGKLLRRFKDVHFMFTRDNNSTNGWMISAIKENDFSDYVNDNKDLIF